MKKWYFKSSSLIVGFLMIGPFILPLVWKNPKYSKNKKIYLTLIIGILSLFLLKAVVVSFNSIHEYYNMMNGM